MNSKKKAPAAQQLIDSLLDELPLLSKRKTGRGGGPSRLAVESGPHELVFTPGVETTGEVILDDGQHIVIRDEDTQAAVPSKPAKMISKKPIGKASPPPPPATKIHDHKEHSAKKKPEVDSNNSVVFFDGNLGSEGTRTMLLQAGAPQKRPSVKKTESESQEAATSAKKPGGAADGTISHSSPSKPQSLHIHSLKELEDDRFDRGVDLMAEGRERAELDRPRPNRILPKSESTPRSEIKDALQVVDNESHEDLIHKPFSLSVIIQNQEIDLDLESDEPVSAALDEPNLPLTPDQQTPPAAPPTLAGVTIEVVAPASGKSSGQAWTQMSAPAPVLAQPQIPTWTQTGAQVEAEVEIQALTRAQVPIPQPQVEAPAVGWTQIQARQVQAPELPQVQLPQVQVSASETQAQVDAQPAQDRQDELETSAQVQAHSSLVPTPMDEHLEHSAEFPAAGPESIEETVSMVPAQKPEVKADKEPSGQKESLHRELLAFESGRAVLGKVFAKVRDVAGAGRGSAKAKTPSVANSGEQVVVDARADAHWTVQATEPFETPERLDSAPSEAVSAPTEAMAVGPAAVLNGAPKIAPAPVIETVPTDEAEAMSAPNDSTLAIAHDIGAFKDDEPSSALSLELPPEIHAPSEPLRLEPAAVGWTQQGSGDGPSEVSKDGPLDTMDRLMATQIRPGAARARAQQEQFASQGKENLNAGKPGGHFGIPAFHSAEASLKQSESLRIAQTRISDLEHELERLRRENEKLASAGETLRRHSDELRARAENAEQERRESERIRDEERKVMRGQMSQKDRENLESRQRLEEAEGRLESNFKKIRVRERELEHRLEIMKMESATLVSTKDKMILDLKRQIDQLVHENEYGKQKAQEAFNQYKGKQETQRRVVRALRIALTILEGDDENVVPGKKAE